MRLYHKLRLSLRLTTPTVCVLVLGQPSSGKTSVVAALRSARKIAPSAALPLGRLPLCSAVTARPRKGGKLLLLDCSREAPAEVREALFPCAQVVLYTLDATTPVWQLQAVQDALDWTLSAKDLARVPVLFLLTKTDAPGAISLEAAKAALEPERSSGSRRLWAMQSASAETGAGVAEAAEWINSAAVRRGAVRHAEEESKAALHQVAKINAKPVAR